MTPSTIAALTPRLRCAVVGRIVAVRSSELPCVRTDAEIDDGTGVVLLRFDGRRRVPGLLPGRRVVAEGTPAAHGSRLVMRNPLYSFLGDG